MDPSSNVIYHEGQVLGDALGQRVGDTYIFNANTPKVLDNINKRLSEEDRSNRSYRRFLSFSQILHKDLIPILLASSNDFDVFEAVIRLLVNLRCPWSVCAQWRSSLSQTAGVRQCSS